MFTFLDNNKLSIESLNSIPYKKRILINEFNKKLNKMKYIENMTNYKVRSPKKFHEDNGGICWDYVVAEAQFFKENNIPFKCYCVIGSNDNHNIIDTHTFIIVGDSLWFESAWKPMKGLHIKENPKSICLQFVQYYNERSKYILCTEYNPIETIDMTESQFIKYVNKSKEVLGGAVVIIKHNGEKIIDII